MMVVPTAALCRANRAFVPRAARTRRVGTLHAPRSPFLEVLRTVPDVWLLCDPITLVALIRTHPVLIEYMPLAFICRLPAYARMCTSRHLFEAVVKRRTRLDSFHRSRMWVHHPNCTCAHQFPPRPSERALACSALLLLNITGEDRPVEYAMHFCIECRRRASTREIVQHSDDWIRLYPELNDKETWARFHFPNPGTRAAFLNQRLDPDTLGMHNQPLLCRSCATTQKYTDVDSFCAAHKIPYWSISVKWRNVFGLALAPMPQTSSWHNGRYAPYSKLMRATRKFRGFHLVPRLCDIPPADLCIWQPDELKI